MNVITKYIFFIILLIFSLPAFSQHENYDRDKLFTVKELKEDLSFYKKKLEQINPTLYRYTSKAGIDLFFDSLSNSIQQSMTDIDFYNIITLLNSKIKDGHTMILPGEAATNYFNTHAAFFPFYVIATADKIFVNMNCTGDTTAHEADEIASINGVPAQKIMEFLLMRQVRDGNNQTYPLWILNSYFKSYYSFSFGHPASFELAYKHNGVINKTSVAALPNDSIQFYRQQKYAWRLPGPPDQKGITIEINKDIQAAFLTIKDFHDDVLKNTYHQQFVPEIKKAFSLIQENNIRSLVIDLRDNQGGDIENGQELLSYLLDSAFSIIDKGPSSGIVAPNENVYKGKLYVLINGGSFSNSGIVSSCLEKHGRAVFIGEETGGNKTAITGNSKSITLPNTRFVCEIAAREYVLRSGVVNNGHGIMPTYYCMPSVTDIIAGKDKVKEFVMNLIVAETPMLN
jgi:hypothetical protein